MSEYQTPDRVPARALLLSLGSLAVPVTSTAFFPDWTGEEVGLLLWLAALVPAFLLTYYRGWKGASVGLASGMAALALAEVAFLTVSAQPPRWTLLFALVAAYVTICLGVGWVGEMLHRARNAAERMALVDPLTGLANRRHLDVFLSAAFSAARQGSSMALVLFDLDHFKGINDRQGHAAGDMVIRALGEILRRETGRADLSARFGGEEFITILTGCDRQGAVGFAERVRAEMAARRFAWGGVTVSAGVAVYGRETGSPDVLVAAADRALYRAKDEGRDRVRVAEPPLPEPGTETRGWSASERPETERVVAEAGAADSPGSPGSGPPGGRETVLVVEDDAQTLSTISRALELLGYRVEQALDPVVALDRVRSGSSVDLILSDIVMPRMSGLTLADRVLESWPTVRVVLMSGYDHDDASWEAMPATVAGFLKKPMTLGELAARVRTALDETAQPQVGPTR